MSEPCDLTAWELASRLATRELSSAEIVRSSLDRIHAVDDRLGAFLADRSRRPDDDTGPPRHRVA